MPTATKMAGSLKRQSAAKGEPVAAKPRGETKNTDDPRGQFGAFLRDWIDRHDDGDESKLADKLKVSDRTIRKWCEGANAPPLGDLQRIAEKMGFADWSKLAAAIVKHATK